MKSARNRSESLESFSLYSLTVYLGVHTVHSPWECSQGANDDDVDCLTKSQQSVVYQNEEEELYEACSDLILLQ